MSDVSPVWKTVAARSHAWRTRVYLLGSLGTNPFFKSRHVDRNLVFLFKLWDLTDGYRTLELSSLTGIGLVVMNSLRLRFALNGM